MSFVERFYGDVHIACSQPQFDPVLPHNPDTNFGIRFLFNTEVRR